MTAISYTIDRQTITRDVSAYSPRQPACQDLRYWLFSWPILMEVGGVFPLEETGNPPRIPVVATAYRLAHAGRSLSRGEEASFDTGGSIRGTIRMRPDPSAETVYVVNDHTGVGARVPLKELLSAITDFADRVRKEMRAILPDIEEDEVVGEWCRQEGPWAAA